MTLQDLTHVEVRNQKAARTPKKTCPKCKMQVPVARQRCENCPHQFISNAAPDREARKAARKEKKRLRAHLAAPTADADESLACGRDPLIQHRASFRFRGAVAGQTGEAGASRLLVS